jgi:N-methylhydantoinase A
MLDPKSGMRIGVDIGGTFTDLCVADERGVVAVGKVLTTQAQPARGVEEVLSETLSSLSLEAGAVRQVIHATTLVTNALLQRSGARVALLATAGFRDVLEMRRERRADIYDLMVEHPRPLVPRHLRFDVPERVLADGSIEQQLDVAFVERLGRELAERGVEAVAVCFLHSFANPANERAAREALARVAPRLRVALSSEVVPEIREYERSTTTAASVYVQDLVERYLSDLEARLRRLRVGGELRIMLSNGGVATVATAAQHPVRMLESGPAAGALAAASFGSATGRSSLLSFDMGGTTAKLCVVDDGRPLVTHDFEVDRVYRLRKGSGLPVKTPVIDMIEIGVGGGSLARVTALGLLAVGPESAGADPGPACYSRGGSRPTVTDADLVLGYLNPDFFLGGRMRLDVEAARRAILDHVASPLGASVEEAAWGIHRQVNEDMASAARVHAAERGHDPSELPVFAFGGAGPVHAAGVTAALGSPAVFAPARAGVMSAVGMLAAPLAFEFVRSQHEVVENGLPARAAEVLADMEAEGTALLEASGVSRGDIEHERSADMRYAGQGFELRVWFGPEPDADLRAAFERAYEAKYGRRGPDVAVEVLSWRVVSRGPAPTLRIGGMAEAPDRPPKVDGDARKGERPAWFPRGGFEPVPVYDRYALRAGDRLPGPAIVEERESTLVVPPEATCSVAEDLSLVMRP